MGGRNGLNKTKKGKKEIKMDTVNNKVIICKHCGGTQFNVKTIRDGVVELTLDENGALLTNIVSEEATVSIQYVSCAACGHGIDQVDANNDMIEALPCSNCGVLTACTELDLSGQCQICANPRPDLIGLNQTALIKRILDLENQLKNAKHPMSEETLAAVDAIEKSDQVV